MTQFTILRHLGTKMNCSDSEVRRPNGEKSGGVCTNGSPSNSI